MSMLTPSFVRIHTENQKNTSTIARKVGLTNSTRKPLGDRAVNQTPFGKINQPSAKKVLSEKPPKIRVPSSEKTKKPMPIDWFTHRCTCIDKNEDTYDIFPKVDKLDVKKILNSMLDQNRPKTLVPPEEPRFQPMLMDSPQKMKQELFPLFEIPLMEIEVPRFSF